MPDSICQLADNRLREGTLGCGASAVPAGRPYTCSRAAPDTARPVIMTGLRGARWTGTGEDAGDTR